MDIQNAKYFPYPRETNTNILTYIVVFNNGKKWNIIPLDFLKKNPIIYDKIYEHGIKDRMKQQENVATIDISITYCPYTFTLSIFEGKYKIYNKRANDNIILQSIDNKNIILEQLTGRSYNIKTRQRKTVRRWECYVLTMRESLLYFRDPSYFINTTNKTKSVNVNIKKLTPIYAIIYDSKTLPIAIINKDDKFNIIKYKTLTMYIKEKHSNLVKNLGLVVYTTLETLSKFYKKYDIVKL